MIKTCERCGKQKNRGNEMNNDDLIRRGDVLGLLHAFVCGAKKYNTNDCKSELEKICREELSKAMVGVLGDFEKLMGELPADVKSVVRGEWIPVMERLPEIDMTFPHSERYLVQYKDGHMDVASWSNVDPLWTNLVTEPHWNCAQFQTVVAWMSLPEPYRKEEANDE